MSSKMFTSPVSSTKHSVISPQRCNHRTVFCPLLFHLLVTDVVCGFQATFNLLMKYSCQDFIAHPDIGSYGSLTFSGSPCHLRWARSGLDVGQLDLKHRNNIVIQGPNQRLTGADHTCRHEGLLHVTSEEI